ncbi:MalY/PatB family protein [Candidatus Harpocratesius sp.]
MVNNLNKIHDRKNTDSIKWNSKLLNEWFHVKDVLPLWVADMDFRVPEAVIEAIKDRAEHGIFGYSFADDSYYQAVINWFDQNHNWKIKKNWILITPGVVPAINMLIQTFSRPGDQIIIQEPVYYPFKEGILANGRRPLINELKIVNGRYEMDFEDLEKKIQKKRVKMLILCSPHNPVGRVWSREELKTLGDLCLKNNILVISDEIHCDLIFSSHSHIPFASICSEFAENSITCTAASKTFNIAGLQASNIIIPNSSLRNEFKTTLQALGLSGGANIFGMLAIKTAYNKGKEWLKNVLSYIYQNYLFLKEFFSKYLFEAFVFPLEGTYLVWVDFRSLGITSKELDVLLKHQAKVLLDDGGMFGECGQGFQRFNIACPRLVLEETLNRIVNAVRIHIQENH